MYSYRCGRCRIRRSFRQPLHWYTRDPRGTKNGKCACGGNLSSTDAEIKRWNKAQETCHCGLIPYPHRKGSCDRNYGRCEAHPQFEPFDFEPDDLFSLDEVAAATQREVVTDGASAFET